MYKRQVIGLRTHIVEEIINRIDHIAVQIACYNTPNQTIVAGPQDVLELVDDCLLYTSRCV